MPISMVTHALLFDANKQSLTCKQTLTFAFLSASMTTSPEVCWHLNTHLSILSGRCFPGVTGSLCVSCSGITVARINNTPHVLDVRRQAPGMQRPYYGMWIVQSGSVKKESEYRCLVFQTRQEAAGVLGEQRTGVSVKLRHQRGEAAGLQMKVELFESLLSPLSSALEGELLPLLCCHY